MYYVSDGNEMDLDSLGSCDSGDVVTGIDSMESLLAYTVDKRQRNAEAASPELRKEALLSNTVKRAHRLLSLSHDDSGLMSHDDKIQNYFVDEPFGQDDFTQDTNHADTDEQIDVTNDRVSCQVRMVWLDTVHFVIS